MKLKYKCLVEIEFSAKRRRRRFGIINAIPKASANLEVPRKAAFVISRTSPKILDKSVKKESESPEVRSELFAGPALGAVCVLELLSVMLYRI